MMDRAPDGTRRFDAIVTGRGVIGLAAALALARQSLKVAIVGPAPKPKAAALPAHDDDWDARVLALSPASRTLLQQIRVWDTLPAERIAPVYDMRVFDTGGAPLHFGAYDSGVDALAWIIENRTLLRALEPTLRYADVVQIDAEVNEVRTHADAAQISLSDGSLLTCALLVGADGARSRVREQCGLAAHVTPYDQTAVVANFRTDKPHLDTAYQWFGSDGVLALLPLAGGTKRRARMSMVWSAPHAHAERLLGLDAAGLAAAVERASGGLLGGFETITPAQGHALQRLTVSRTTRPRVVLIGDAAHTIHPLAGQGMNMGLGDVAELVHVLAAREPRRDPGDALLLRRYERGRREAVDSMQLLTDGLHGLFYRGVPAPLALARDVGWRLLDRSGWLKRQLVMRAMQ